ncbi:MAG: hypothetical protein JO171_06755 [Paludibacterium sp.]|uniref:hypothetical protein n=1 Tax=Paludibacterium sp. TaxID=1917523 RepID=UPI0025FBABA8|nr:hypothetical protein [Paludibacterium sp.]MBV8046832.1 hypothetical protein [Paludibacterium sp.]MBV8646869.1 hypothetical protein [Paludibacterium sp.]
MPTRPVRLCAALLIATLNLLPLYAQAADASAPPPAASAVHALAQTYGAGRLSQAELNTAEQSAVAVLVRQNLRALDPDGRLGPEGIKALSTRLGADIRPAVRQVFAALRPADMTAEFETTLSGTLSQQDADSLLTYWRTPAGQRYLRFSHALDDLAANGLSRLISTPISFSRDQMPPPAVQQQRRGLLAMSTGLNTRAPHAAIEGVILDWLALQNGPALDRLGQQYQADLPAFVRFQASAPAQALARAQARWASQQGRRIEPLIQQADQALAPRRTGWQSLARHWLSDPNIGK